MIDSIQTNGNIGYLKLSRAIAESDLIKDPSALAVFIWLLCRVRWQDTPTTCRGVTVGTGQYLTSVRSIAKDLGVRRMTAARALERLEAAGRITRIEFGQPGTLVAVTNWAKYQTPSAVGEPRPNSDPPNGQGGSQMGQGWLPNGTGVAPKWDTEKEGNEEEGKSKKKSSCRGKSPTPADPHDRELAEWMAVQVAALFPSGSPPKEPNLDSWADVIRLMRTRDGRQLPEIRDLFAWCNADDFWRRNILSPAKLREKWDRLVLQRTSRRDSPNGTPKLRHTKFDPARVGADDGF
jgi:hypothetical protein